MPVIPLCSRSGLEAPTPEAQLIVYNTFAFLGVFSNAAILAPAIFRPNIHRPKVWFGVIIASMIDSISYLLLIGRQTGHEPPLGLCFFQASLIYASPLLLAGGFIGYTVHYSLQVLSRLRWDKEADRRYENLLVALPWILFVIVFVEVQVMVPDSHIIRRDSSHFYCHVTSDVPSMIVASVIILSVVVLFPLEIYTAVKLRRDWGAFRRLSRTYPSISITIFLRLALFPLAAGMALGLSAVIVAHTEGITSSWSLATIMFPIVSALAFGTHRDILNAWMFWKKMDPDTSRPENLVPKVQQRLQLE